MLLSILLSIVLFLVDFTGFHDVSLPWILAPILLYVGIHIFFLFLVWLIAIFETWKF